MLNLSLLDLCLNLTCFRVTELITNNLESTFYTTYITVVHKCIAIDCNCTQELANL